MAVLLTATEQYFPVELLSMLCQMIITIESVDESVSAGYWMSVVYRIEGEMTLGETVIGQRLTFDRLAWQLCKTNVLNKYGNSWNPLICVCRKSSKRTANLFHYIFARGKRLRIL